MNFGGRIAVGDVLSLMRHAPKSASYKPALLKALVRACRKHATPEISLETLGAEFTSMYWNQTVVYHLRQAASLSKESVAVKLIREMARIHNVRILSDLPQAARLKLDRQMARLLPVNVLDAFHSTKPQGMSAMYEWHAGSSSISIAPGVRDFINQNAATLELIANYYWAEFLERTNLLAPKILRKVSTNAAKRASLQRYLKILRPESGDSCFYCGDRFDATRPPTVDHVIPWSFLLEDALWDLVLACGRCNSEKSDWLPAPGLLKKLIERNRTQYDDLRSHVSFLVGAPEIERLYDAAISVEWPHPWTPR